MARVAMTRSVLHDAMENVDIECLIFYPVDESNSTHEQLLQMGPFSLRCSIDSALAAGRHNLVIISHGSGGSPASHHQLATGLASTGYCVCLPEHPFNNRRDNSGEGKAQTFVSRLRHISLCIDHVAAHPLFAAQIATHRVGYIGHSIGANVGMLLCGAKALDVNEHRKLHGLMFHEDPERYDYPELSAESRIVTAALFALVPTWFQHTGALSTIHADLLLLNGAQDPYIPLQSLPFVNTEGCSKSVEQELVANAGHFSFLSCVDGAWLQRTGPLGRDPEGFDRSLFQQELLKRVISLFQHADVPALKS